MMAAIAKAMGFPLTLWSEDGPQAGLPGRTRDLADRVEHLFGTVKNPGTGELHTDADAARMSLGSLTEDDVEGIRMGRIADPRGRIGGSAGERLPTSWTRIRDRLFWTRSCWEPCETVRSITRRRAGVPERERRLVLGIVRQFGELKETGAGL